MQFLQRIHHKLTNDDIQEEHSNFRSVLKWADLRFFPLFPILIVFWSFCRLIFDTMVAMTGWIHWVMLFACFIAKTASFLVNNRRQTTTSLFASAKPIFLYNNVLLRPTASVSSEKKAPVVILHGLLGAARNFQSWSKLYQQKELDYCQQQQAAITTRDVVCIDLHNHGRSACLGSLDMDFTNMARDVRYTLAKLGLTKVTYPPITHTLAQYNLSIHTLSHVAIPWYNPSPLFRFIWWVIRWEVRWPQLWH